MAPPSRRPDLYRDLRSRRTEPGIVGTLSPRSRTLLPGGISLDGLGAPDQVVDLVPQRAAFPAFGRGQLLARSLVQQPGQVGVAPEVRQLVAGQDAIRMRAVVQRPGPEGDLGPEPFA